MTTVITSRLKPAGAQPGDLYIYVSAHNLPRDATLGGQTYGQHVCLQRWTDGGWQVLERKFLPAREVWEPESKNKIGRLGAYATHPPLPEHTEAAVTALRTLATQHTAAEV